jgi:hypothetical protein
MSGNMLGLMLAGPCRIDPARVPELATGLHDRGLSILSILARVTSGNIADLLHSEVTELERINETLECDGREPILEEIEDLDERQEVLEEIMRFLGFSEQTVDGYETEPLEKFVDSFVGFWNGEEYASDTALRDITLGDRDYRIVFAGEMSWGDEPDGTGYRWMRRAIRTGLTNILGLQ